MTKRSRWFVHSPGVDPTFSVTRYVAHLARTVVSQPKPCPPRPRPSVGRGQIGITWIGHATVLIELDGVILLTDPVLSSRLFVVPRLIAPGIPEGGLPAIDLVLVSHGHHDHLDIPSHRRLGGAQTRAVCAKGLSDLLMPSGYAGVQELAWGESFELGPVRVTALEVNHWGTRNLLPDDRGYCGFLIEGPSGSVFFPGDTAYTPLFREYGERLSVDVALLPIGAYRPDSFRRVHMNPEDAMQAFLDLRGRYLVPIHWGTFVLSYEPIDEPPRWIRKLAEDAGCAERLLLLEHGSSAVVEGRSPRERGANQSDRDSSLSAE